VIVQFGSIGHDDARGISIDINSKINITGTTYGDIDGTGPATNYDAGDVFVARFDFQGNLEMVNQYGTVATPTSDLAVDMVSDNVGNSFVSGISWADFDGAGPSQYWGGFEDVIMIRYANTLP
jgi:hypothetical protein